MHSVGYVLDTDSADGGIYRKIELPSFKRKEAEALLFGPRGPLESILHLGEFEQVARRIARTFLRQSKSGQLEVDLGDGVKRYKLTRELTDRENDLVELLGVAHGLRHAVRTGEPELAAMWGCQLGRLAERLALRHVEPLVSQEKKRRKGHRDRFEREKAEKQQQAIAAYSEFRRRDPHGKKLPLVRRVAQQLKCSEKSAWNYLRGIP